MPPLGIPKDDVPISTTPQYLPIALLAGLLMIFSSMGTYLIMRATQKEAAPPPPAAPVTVTTADGEVQVDPQEYIKTFESQFKEIVPVKNNIFYVGNGKTSLTIEREGATELRTYVTWNEVEGMPKNQAWVVVDLLEMTDGKTPVVSRTETLLNEAEIVVVNGVSVTFDPGDDEQIVITLDSTKYWGAKHPGAKH